MEHQTNSCFTDYSCKDFITVLSGKSPVPGGGGAAALAGAIGIALGNMVGSLTVGKKTYAAVEEDIIQCKKKADDITARLLDLVEKDAEAFEPLSANRIISQHDSNISFFIAAELDYILPLIPHKIIHCNALEFHAILPLSLLH